MPLIPQSDYSFFGRAVNQVLSFAQLSPMNDTVTDSIDEDNAPITNDADIIDAYNFLLRASTVIQEDGYPFNTLHEYEINPTVAGIPQDTGNLILPANTLRFEPIYKCRFDKEKILFTRQNNKLYDMTNDTDLFDQSYSFNIVLGLLFKDLVPAVRQYITVTAGLEFQKFKLGSDSLDRQRNPTWIEAKASFERYVVNLGDYNLLDNIDFHYWNESYRRVA